MIKSRILLIVIIIFSVFGCIFIGGYVALEIFTSDKAIKTRITNVLENATGGKLNIEDVHFDLFKGLTLNKVKFEGKEPENLRVNVERIIIRHEPLALLRGEILLNNIIILSPELFLGREKGAIWRFLDGVKAFLDHANLKYPTGHLGNGVIVKSADIHVFDEAVFRGGVLNIENLDLFGQHFGGSLRNIIIKGIINDGIWKGLELNVETNFTIPELKLTARLRDKTMTEELMKELPVIGETFWMTYSPTGKFNFDCALNFNNKDYKEMLYYLLELDAVDAELTYRKWPLPVKHVSGKLEYSKEGVFLKSVKGDVQNEGRQSHGEIDAFFGVGNSKKSINISIPNFNVTETLMKMIPGAGEKAWNDYRPEGNIDLKIKYESNEDKSVVDYSTEAICKGIKAKHPYVPCDMSNIIGLLEMDGEKLYFKNMSGYLLNGANINRTMFDGVIDLKSGEKRFTISVPNLDMTEEIVKSIPEKGEAIWSKYKPTGQVDLKLNYKGFKDSSKDRYLVTADGKGNEIEYADLSLNLSDIIGRIVIDNNNVQLKNVRGYIVNDHQLSRAICDGRFELKNKDKKTLFNVFDLRVTEELLAKFSQQIGNEFLKIEPVGWVDVILDDEINEANGTDRHSIIIDAKGCEIGLKSVPVTITDIDGRISIEGGQLISRKFNGICGGGKVNGSVKLDRSSPEGEYTGILNFEGISLRRFMANFIEDHHKWSGMCQGNMEFQGKGTDMNDFTANGYVKLREGYISDVPVLLSILKLLNLSIPKKESFHTVNLRYSIKDKIVDIEELEVLSDSIELGCVGTVGFDKTINLTVVAGLNKETFSQIPFIGGLMDFVVGGVRKKLTKVQITGTFSEPKSTMIGLKPFTYPIKSIFDLLSKNKDDKKENGAKENERKVESDTSVLRDNSVSP